MASRILVSAYACEPGKGSEPGVGWNWALTLARSGHKVWVLTRKNNALTVDPELSRLDSAIRSNLEFIYYDLPKWARWWKKGGRGVRLYYLFWQWGAYLKARRLHARVGFDRVHHATFVSVRQPSFMGGLGIPFVFGPVGGGEHAPWSLRRDFGLRGWLLDGVRDLANALVQWDPMMWRTFRQAERIYVTSEQSRALVPARYRHKTEVRLAIGIEGEPQHDALAADVPAAPRFLYLGRFLYWKGMHLGMRAFAAYLKRTPSARLSMIGTGPDELRLRRLAHELGIEASVDWSPWVRQAELGDVYRAHHALLFPSLHDSGGMVALEALQHGLPVVCLKLGGPGVIVDDTCGVAVDAEGGGRQALVSRLATALHTVTDPANDLARMRAGARARAGAFSWDALVASVYGATHATVGTPGGRM